MSTTLKKITAEAKRIVKRAPKTKWVNAIKQAGAKYRAGKLGTVKKKAAKKAVKKAAKKKATRARRVGSVAPKVSAGFGLTNIQGSIAGIKRATVEQIGKLEARKFAAKTKTEKKRIAKKIAEKKRVYRKFI